MSGKGREAVAEGRGWQRKGVEEWQREREVGAEVDGARAGPQRFPRLSFCSSMRPHSSPTCACSSSTGSRGSKI
eukprot:3170421-Pyramimonas_sp.AAC.1